MQLSINICSIQQKSTTTPPSLGNLPWGWQRICTRLISGDWSLSLWPQNSSMWLSLQLVRTTPWGTSVWPIMRAVFDRWCHSSHGSPSGRASVTMGTTRDQGPGHSTTGRAGDLGEPEYREAGVAYGCIWFRKQARSIITYCALVPTAQLLILIIFTYSDLIKFSFTFTL